MGKKSRTILCFVVMFLLAPQFPAQQANGSFPLRVRLTAPLSTKVNQKGDKVTAVVIAPADLQNSFMEGVVKESKASGSIKKESVLNFSFTTLHHRGQAIPVRSEITEFFNSKGQARVDEEGQIIDKRNDLGKALLFSAIGAGIGAAAGGAKGAAIGSGAGIAAGLLFVKFGAKAPQISFDKGSEFNLSVSRAR